jgi:tetratricopeptide (TPR) repeat protein
VKDVDAPSRSDAHHPPASEIPAASPLARASAALQRGQSAEALALAASLDDALRHYDAAIALLMPPAADVEHRRLLAVAWMNRGNALQKQNATVTAVAAYDEAIALLRALPFDRSPVLRNHLGAAWLNRGHALRGAKDAASLAEALRSHREAIALLAELPLDASPAYRANLAGAWINLADTLLASDEPNRFAAARDAAQHASVLTGSGETASATLAQLGLMAHRAHLMALGHLLVTTPSAELVAETSDCIDAALALARQWESAGLPTHAFATRLLFFGAEFYRRHQPHFLAEFLVENLDAARGAPPAWARSPELHGIAIDALLRADADLREPRLCVAGDAATERLLATRDSLAAAAAFFGAPPSSL